MISEPTGTATARPPRLVLPVVLAGTFMAILDVAIVNVAIPSIRSGLHAGFGAVGLVVTVYTVVYACLLVTGGRLGDKFGRRRLFILGLLGFSIASALCGAAPTAGLLIAARALQGGAAAMMYPQVLAIVQVTYSGQARAKALGLFGAVIGVAAIAGQLIGGLLIAANLFGLTWRSTFFVNVPIGLLAAAAAAKVLPRDEPDSETRLDLIGAVLLAVTVVMFVVPLLQGRELGWPLWVLLCLAGSAPAAGVFLLYERRRAQLELAPLVRLSLFRHRDFAAGVPLAGLFTASYAGFLFVLAVYLQTGLGRSALASGLVYTPAALGFLITSLLAPRLVPLLGRSILTLGYVIAALGLLATAATAHAAGAGVSAWELVPPLFIAGLGQGLGMSPLVGIIVAGLPTKDAGAGAGVVTTTLQIGNAIGIALLGLLLFTVLGDGHTAARYASAFSYALPACAALLVLAAILTRRLPGGPEQTANVIIERNPGWATGFGYSMFLATGGRIGDKLFADILGRVTQTRTRRTQQAPQDPEEFLAYHFDAEADDLVWLQYLMREALAYGSRPVPHEDERVPVIQAQVDEIRRRQAVGVLRDDIDPEILRLVAFALVSYPRLLPQIIRMTTGQAADDAAFIARWRTVLRRLGRLLRPDDAANPGPLPLDGHPTVAATDPTVRLTTHPPAADTPANVPDG